MALLTQPMSQKKVHGPIISEWQAVRHYCLSQLRTVWMHMRNNLSMSDEERAFFITQCLMNLYEVGINSECYNYDVASCRDVNQVPFDKCLPVVRHCIVDIFLTLDF